MPVTGCPLFTIDCRGSSTTISEGVYRRGCPNDGVLLILEHFMRLKCHGENSLLFRLMQAHRPRCADGIEGSSWVHHPWLPRALAVLTVSSGGRIYLVKNRSNGRALFLIVLIVFIGSWWRFHWKMKKKGGLSDKVFSFTGTMHVFQKNYAIYRTTGCVPLVLLAILPCWLQDIYLQHVSLLGDTHAPAASKRVQL